MVLIFIMKYHVNIQILKGFAREKLMICIDA